jgi:hypothetical protein
MCRMAPAVRWATRLALWTVVAAVWLFPSLDLPLRGIAGFGLTAAICRDDVAGALKRAMGVFTPHMATPWPVRVKNVTMRPAQKTLQPGMLPPRAKGQPGAPRQSQVPHPAGRSSLLQAAGAEPFVE